MLTNQDDATLVRSALALVAHIDSEREAARELGVAPRTLGEWRDGDIKPLRAPTREKLTSKLSGEQDGGRAAAAPPPGVDPGEFFRRWDAIQALDISQNARLLLSEMLLAGIRNETQRQETVAAKVRAQAIDREAGGAEVRARAIERETENASARLALHRGEEEVRGEVPPDRPGRMHRRVSGRRKGQRVSGGG